MASLPKGWKGSHGLEGSVVPDMLTGVFLPEDVKDRGKYQHKEKFSFWSLLIQFASLFIYLSM